MLDWFKTKLLTGAHHQSPAVIRQVLITNLTATMSLVLTSLYLLFYLTHDAVYFLPLILANLFFAGGYPVAILP